MVWDVPPLVYLQSWDVPFSIFHGMGPLLLVRTKDQILLHKNYVKASLGIQKNGIILT
jgi:hypothetical protein